jgi:flagellar hook-associated protein 3 FlgL
MRITLGMITTGIRNNLSSSTESLLDAQNRASSGKRIQKPSDDVPGTGRAMQLKSALSSMDQFQRNADTAKSVLTATSDALSTIIAKLNKVRQDAAASVNGVVGEEGKAMYSSELADIESDLKNIANTRYLDRYLFSGDMTDTEALASAPGGGFTYQGDNGVFSVQIAPGTYVQANTTADTVFNIGSAAKPGVPDVFETIEALRHNIETGNFDAISDQLTEIDKQTNNVTGIRSQLGSRIDRLESTSAALTDTQIKLKERLSATEDVDITEAIVDLQTRQNVYQAALAVAGKILGQNTLIDYMR